MCKHWLVHFFLGVVLNLNHHFAQAIIILTITGQHRASTIHVDGVASLGRSQFEANGPGLWLYCVAGLDGTGWDHGINTIDGTPVQLVESIQP